jgi:hypothetical protein
MPPPSPLAELAAMTLFVTVRVPALKMPPPPSFVAPAHEPLQRPFRTLSAFRVRLPPNST